MATTTMEHQFDVAHQKLSSIYVGATVHVSDSVVAVVLEQRDLLIVQNAIAASRKHQAQQSWLEITQTHLLVCFHAKLS